LEEEEIEELVAELRTLLDTNGFGWAREEAESSVDPAWQPRQLARALVAAAETVTVGLAQAELSTTEIFGKEVEFKPDEGAEPDGDALVVDGGAEFSQRAPVDRLRGPQRRQVLENLNDLSASFKELRERLDGRV
jgi:hypothetical protein